MKRLIPAPQAAQFCYVRVPLIPCMFTKQDNAFADAAADPIRRRVAIDDLTYRRNVSFVLACFLTVTVAVASFFSLSALGGYAFLVLYPWIIVQQHQSDLNLLLAIDRLHKSDGNAP